MAAVLLTLAAPEGMQGPCGLRPMLRPKTVVPIHYNTFPVIQQDPHAWARRVKGKRAPAASC